MRQPDLHARITHDLSPGVDSMCATRLSEVSKISHYAVLPEKCIVQHVPRKIGHANDFSGVVHPGCLSVTSSEGTQIPHLTSVPQERVEGLIPRQVRSSGYLTSIIDGVFDSESSAERSEVQHSAIRPKKRIQRGNTRRVIWDVVRERAPGCLAVFIHERRLAIG